MVRWEKLSVEEQRRLDALPCPTFANLPWTPGPPLHQRRVALISTAGLHQRDDRPFTPAPGDFYRIIPDGISSNDLVMSHVSVNFERSGFQQDWNTVFPIDRLHEMAAEGTIQSVAGFHYSFMGADDPTKWERTARQLAVLLKDDNVNAVLLVPV